MKSQSATILLFATLCGFSSSEEVQTQSSSVSNQLTATRECSPTSNKEWSICLGPSNDGSGLFFNYWYCPTNDAYNTTSVVEELQDPMTCITCPGPNSEFADCSSAIDTIAKSYNISGDDAHTQESLRYCQHMCESGVEEDECSTNARCNPGYFCDISSESTSGTCKTCPYDVATCLDDDFVSSIHGQAECYACQMACTEISNSTLTVGGVHLSSDRPISNAIQPMHTNTSGPLIDCSNLILHDVTECLGAQNHICLVEDFTSDTLFWDLSQKAEDNGCHAVIFIPSGGRGGQHSNDELNIPYVFVVDEVEAALLKKSIGEVVTVEVEIFGSACLPNWSLYGLGDVCSKEFPCRNENEYCDYRKTVQGGEYKEGWCSSCPTFETGEPDSAGCFFDRNSGSNVKGPAQVESCAASCMAELSFDECKFCPDGITAFDFGVESSDDQCHFCPSNDIKYPDRLVPLFGPDVTCSNMQAFFERLEVHKESNNCLLAQKANHICGCDGPGYAGANTKSKEALLAWLPRISAALSLMGSSYIIYDTSKTYAKRTKLFNQILMTLSIFDLVGSTAYVFTTLPTPELDYIYGGAGNDATCTTQAFFIQIGTIASYMNVSLAFYYLLQIKHSWNERRLKSLRGWFFGVPICIGLAFAFAGIPFYGNLAIWCNNMAKFWPEFPLVLALFIVTVVMGNLCLHVYRQERKTAMYTGGTPVTKAVFVQSIWFLAAFYFTWIPYLTLQYLWASGKAFYSYGFILYAATSIPAQGFWNFIVYIRRRQVFRETRTSVMKRLSHIRYLLPGRVGQSAETISSTNPKNDVEIEAAVEVVN